MALPPIEVPSGAMRFNSDSQKLEYYDGAQWLQVSTFSPLLNGGARGVFGGGFVNPARINNIEYVTISSTGNSTDFGDLTVPRYGCKWCASSTRGLAGGGNDFPISGHNVIDYITISSTGNAVDFGDRIGAGTELAGAISNQTRGCFAGGFPSSNNVIDYVTITSTGNAQDFGDLTLARGHSNGCSSPTRGLFFGGEIAAAPTFTNIVDYITISTIGNAFDFGDISSARRGLAAFSNATRGLAAGGDGPAYVNNIEYVTMTTLGNTTDFGDLTAARGQSFAGMSSPIRGVFGDSIPAGNTMDYVTIATQGNAVDFGDALVASGNRGGTSNAHGGL
jgi:hypothetical protein